MRRRKDATAQLQSRADGTSAVARLWSEVIKPALFIGLAGAGAVLYLVACARVSVIECDLGRLERIIENERATEFDLQRQLAELRHVERLQQHIAERGLQPPRTHKQVRLTNVPASLYDALRVRDGDRDRREIGIGEIVEGPGVALYASAGHIRSGSNH